jgi:hypothetical protein
MPFYEYAGVSGVASSLSMIADEVVEREKRVGARDHSLLAPAVRLLVQ